MTSELSPNDPDLWQRMHVDQMLSDWRHTTRKSCARNRLYFAIMSCLHPAIQNRHWRWSAHKGQSSAGQTQRRYKVRRFHQSKVCEVEPGRVCSGLCKQGAAVHYRLYERPGQGWRLSSNPLPSHSSWQTVWAWAAVSRVRTGLGRMPHQSGDAKVDRSLENQ